MDAIDGRDSLEGLLSRAEGDGEHRAQGAQKPAEALFPESAVFGNTTGYVWVRDLHEESATAAQEQYALAVYSADHGVVGKG